MYWANEAQWDEFIESREMSAEELGNYDNFVAEERIKEEHERRNQENAEDEQRSDNSESEGGVEVLPGTQPDITRGNEDVAGKSEGVDGNGVESNDVAQEEAAELSEEDRQAIENMPIPTLKRQIKDTATTLFNVSQTSDQWQAENKDKIERAKLLLAYAKQELARKERLKKSNKWGIKIGNSATPFDVVRKMFEEFNSNEDLAQLFEKVAKVFETLPIKVVFSDTIGGKSTQGWFSPTTGTLKLPGYFVYGGGISEQNKAETILHEMIHAVTTYALYINEKPYLQTELGFRLSDDMHAAIRQLKRIYASIANDKDFKGEYGAVSVHEMIAELSNVQFREKLKKKGLWETIVDAIKQLFGITPSNALEGAEAALEYMLNNFDRSQWDKMVGMGEKRGKQMRIGVEKMGSSFEYFTGSLTDLISIAKNAVKGLFKKVIAPVSSRLKEDLATKGIVIDDGYNHVIDNNAIRHTLKKHSGKNEVKRGQIPVVDADFDKITDIVESYDIVEVLDGNTTAQRIIYQKSYSNGIVMFVEEQRAGRKELAAVTMWKKKNPTLTDANRTETTQISDLNEVSTGKGSDNVGDVQGLEDYSAEELKEIAREYIEDVIAESGFDAEVVDLAIYGSRRRGDGRDDSDLDIVVEYSGNAREDDLFNALNDAETQLEIDGVKVDINPITKSKSGTLGELMERVREYDEGNESNESNESNRSAKESQPLTNPSAFGTSPKTGEELGGSLEDDGLLFRDGDVTTSPLGSGGELGTTMSTAEASTVGYSDAEVSMANDPIAKVMGRSQRSKKQQAKFAERERKAMRNRVAELAEKMHLDNVEVVESSQSTPSPQGGTPPKQGSGGELNATNGGVMSERKARAKGWFDTRTGKIVINISNHTSVADVERTLLHEAVAHYGLRQLFGKQFDTFLDNVYRSAEADIRAQIVELAKKHGWDFRTATEEYLAGLAEDTNFEALEHNWSWWQKIKQFFMDMLESIGWRYQGPELSDNELRYLLWRSYENMVNPGRHRSILGMAEDAVRRAKFGIGEYSVDSPAPSQVAESGEKAEPQPIGNGAFGAIYPQFRGKAKEAIAFLMRKQSGEAIGALSHPEIGEIDLVWGKEGTSHSDGYGLAKLVKYHLEVLDNLQEILSGMNVVKRSPNRVQLESNTHKASVRLTWDNQRKTWLLTAFEKKETPETTISSTGVDNSPKGLLDDTAPQQSSSVSADKVNNNNSEKQENNESNGSNGSTNAERDSDEGILFRDGDVTVDDLGERDRVIARDAYERMMSQGRYQFTEAMQDSMMGLKLLYKAILGKKMRVETVFYDTTFRPMIDAKRVKMKNRRRKFVGSLNTKMPIRAVPSAPMPVHIA